MKSFWLKTQINKNSGLQVIIKFGFEVNNTFLKVRLYQNNIFEHMKEVPMRLWEFVRVKHMAMFRIA